MRPSTVLIVLCGLLFAFSAVAVPRSPGPLAIVGSAGGHALPVGAGITGDLAVRYRLSRLWGVGVTGRSGSILPGDAERQAGHPRELLLGLLVGPTLAVPVRAWTLRAALQISHIHHTSLHSWGEHTAANLAGDSSGTVLHRTGAEASLGVTLPHLVDFERWGVVSEIDLAAGVLPSSHSLAWTAGLRLGLGLQQLAGP